MTISPAIEAFCIGLTPFFFGGGARAQRRVSPEAGRGRIQGPAGVVTGRPGARPDPVVSSLPCRRRANCHG
jgi:hypothetical protein